MACLKGFQMIMWFLETVADPGDQAEAQRAPQKNFWRPGSPLSQSLHGSGTVKYLYWISKIQGRS